MAQFIKTKLDIFLASDTNIDQIFLTHGFSIYQNKMYHKDQNLCGGGLFFYMKENILCRELIPAQIGSSSETIFLDITWQTRSRLDIDRYLPVAKPK